MDGRKDLLGRFAKAVRDKELGKDFESGQRLSECRDVRKGVIHK